MKKSACLLGFVGVWMLMAHPVPAIKVEDAGGKKSPTPKPDGAMSFSPSDFRTGGMGVRESEPRDEPSADSMPGRGAQTQPREQAAGAGPQRQSMPPGRVNAFYQIIRMDEGVLAQEPADRGFSTDPAGNRIAGSRFQRMARPGGGAFKRYKDRILVYDDGTVVDGASRLVMRIREGVPTRNITLSELQNLYQSVGSQAWPWVLIDPDASAPALLKQGAVAVTKKGEFTVPQLYSMKAWRRDELLPEPQ